MKDSPEQRLHDFIDLNQTVSSTGWVVTVIQVSIMVSCFALLEIFDAELSALTEYFARRDVNANDATLFVPESDFFHILLLFGLILVLSNLAAYFVTMNKGILASILAVDRDAAIAKIGLISRSDEVVFSGQEYARRLVRRRPVVFGLIGAGFLASAAVSWTIEAHNYTLITLEGVTKVKGLSRKPRVFVPWSAATHYHLGCEYIANAKRGPKNFAVMTVQQGDKEIVDLGNTVPMSGDWLENVEKINEKLTVAALKRTDANVHFSTDSVERCLAAFEENLSQDEFERFKRLITR